MAVTVRVTTETNPAMVERAIGRQVQDWLTRKTMEANQAIRSTAPVDTFKLQSMIRTEFQGAGTHFVGIVRSDAPYTGFVIHPTRPHVITPKRAKVLRFPAKGGAIVYAHRVQHPGTKGQNFMLDGLRAVF